MLRKDELAALHPAGARLAELAKNRVDSARRVAIDREALDRMFEDVGRQRENGPPVAGRARRGAGLGHRIALPEQAVVIGGDGLVGDFRRSAEHTSELQSLMRISYAVFCLKNTTETKLTVHAY